MMPMPSSCRKNGSLAWRQWTIRKNSETSGKNRQPIPERGVLDGDGVSRLTRGFVRYLEGELGWRRITDGAALVPGDLVFTTDVIPDYPAHVFVFLGWRARARQVAVIADNTGYRKTRPLAAGGDRDGFAFALRAPP